MGIAHKAQTPLSWTSKVVLSDRQKRNFIAHYKIKFKLIMIMKIIITMITMVIILMNKVMDDNYQKPDWYRGFSVKIYLF